MEVIKYKNTIISIIIRKNFKNKGISFFTPNSFSMQLAQMTHDKNKVIQPHYHKNILRRTLSTQETLIIKKGKLKVLLFNKKKFLCTKILTDGDIILLSSGGHAFKVLKKTTFVEVKQGPYVPKKDKILFKYKKLNK